MIQSPAVKPQQWPEEAEPASTDRRRWYVVLVLMAIYATQALDRQLIAVVLDPIKREFGLSDTTLGFLTGTCYAISFAVAGIPLGMLVDRINRRNLLAGAVLLWSAATAISGLATSYLTLVAARIGLAAAEAPSVPCSVSMLSDLFVQRQRSTAIGFYGMGLGLGGLAGFALGGIVAAHWGWHAVFFVGGLPGLVLALILLATVREPVRRGADGRIAQAADAPTLRATLGFILSQQSLLRTYVAYIILALTTSATLGFLPSFYIRIHGLGIQEVGLVIGLGYGLATVAGSLLGGIIADRLGKRDVLWISRFAAAGAALVTAASAGMVMVPQPAMAVGLMIVWSAAFVSQVGPNLGLAQSLVGTRMRGTATATLNTLVNFLAMGLGAPLAGALSDFFARWAGGGSIRYALLTVAALNLIAILQFSRVGRTLIRDMEKAARI